MQLIASIYKCNKEDVFLNELKFEIYQTATAKSSFNLEKLPPTEESAKQHCYRVYLQLQSWLGNQLTATDWGWQHHLNGLMPRFTEHELIPESLLKSICCSCETGCNNRCGCRKHGVKCSNLCSNCHGIENCSNSEIQQLEEYSDSDDIYNEDTDVHIIENQDLDEVKELDKVEDLVEKSEETLTYVESDDVKQISKKMRFN